MCIIIHLIPSYLKQQFTNFLLILCTSFFNINLVFRSYTDPEGKERGSSVEYNFPLTINGFQKRNTRIHFENNTPFAVFKEVEKTIEV